VDHARTLVGNLRWGGSIRRCGVKFWLCGILASLEGNGYLDVQRGGGGMEISQIVEGLDEYCHLSREEISEV